MQNIMVTILVLMLAFPEMAACQHENNRKSDLVFRSNKHNYGKLDYLEKANHEFVFKNISDKPLAITNVKTKCDCADIKWLREPIKAGGKGTITIDYNTAIPGSFEKSVYVYTGEESPPAKLIIKGMVKKPDPGDSHYEHYKKKYKN
ncbi:MAG: DUF1573 domain-containing protein [Bacteroidales bacterium]